MCKTCVHNDVSDSENKIVKSVSCMIRVKPSNFNQCVFSELLRISSFSRSIRCWRQVEGSAPLISMERHDYLIPDLYCNDEDSLKFLQFDSGEHNTERT